MTQIEKLQNNLQKCRDMITYKGGTVGDTTGFNHLAKEIETIPAGNADYVYVEDSAIAYEKQVMAGALPKAKLRELGGMTYKWKGITYSTVEGQPWDCTLVQNLSLEAGTYTIHGDRASIVWSKNNAGGWGRTITIEEGDVIDWIRTEEQAASETGTFTIYPYLVRTDVTPNVIVPFPNTFIGLRDAKPIAIINHGANLLNLAGREIVDFGEYINSTQRSFTGNGIIKGFAYNNYYSPGNVMSFEKHENGFKYTNKAGQQSYGIAFDFKAVPGATYYAYFESQSERFYLSEFDANGNFIRHKTSPNLVGNAKAYTVSSDAHWIVFSVQNLSGDVEISYDNFYIGLNMFDGFKPYRADVEIPLPEEITSWSEWGKGIPGYANTYDPESGKYIQRVNTYEFTGNEGNYWAYGTGTDAEQGKYCYAWVILNGSELAKASGYQTSICNYFNNVNTAFSASNPANQIGNYSDTPSGPGMYFVTNIPTVEEWIAYVKELYKTGRPLTVTYALAEPIITDGPIYPNTFDVEGGGVLEFVNEYNYPVPSTITYLRRTV